MDRSQKEGDVGTPTGNSIEEIRKPKGIDQPYRGTEEQVHQGLMQRIKGLHRVFMGGRMTESTPKNATREKILEAGEDIDKELGLRSDEKPDPTQ